MDEMCRMETVLGLMDVFLVNSITCGNGWEKREFFLCVSVR